MIRTLQSPKVCQRSAARYAICIALTKSHGVEGKKVSSLLVSKEKTEMEDSANDEQHQEHSTDRHIWYDPWVFT